MAQHPTSAHFVSQKAPHESIFPSYAAHNFCTVPMLFLRVLHRSCTVQNGATLPAGLCGRYAFPGLWYLWGNNVPSEHGTRALGLSCPRPPLPLQGAALGKHACTTGTYSAFMVYSAPPPHTPEGLLTSPCQNTDQ